MAAARASLSVLLRPVNDTTASPAGRYAATTTGTPFQGKAPEGQLTAKRISPLTNHGGHAIMAQAVMTSVSWEQEHDRPLTGGERVQEKT
jgi:hypothetical protein